MDTANGMADLVHDIPLTPETVFQVASISKQFTAAAISLLAPRFGAPITTRHLTTPAAWGINGLYSVWLALLPGPHHRR